jgi:hypothetical protein
MITNGNILVSMNILMLSFMYAQKYHGKNIWKHEKFECELGGILYDHTKK